MANIQIILQFNGKQLTLPINPEELEISCKSDNTDINIIGIGPATRKGAAGLVTAKIESFFPAPNSYFYTGVTPKTCVEFIKTIQKTENINNNVGKIITTGLPTNLNMYFVIEEFTYDHKAGEEDDIYYVLSIKEYIPYGVQIVTKTLSGLAAARAVSPNVVSSTTASYTVKKGDCLWNIAKACTGNGNDWRALYEINKSVIGNNPNLIKPGQVLTLPNGWSSPTNVTKLKNVSKSNKTNSPLVSTGITYANLVTSVSGNFSTGNAQGGGASGGGGR